MQLRSYIKICLAETSDLVQQHFHSFKQLWEMYGIAASLWSSYLQLGPDERWLCKLGTYVMCDACDVPFTTVGRVACVYAWVSLESKAMYIGSSVNFKQRVYSHVRSMRHVQNFQLRAHRLMHSFGSYRFFPIPLLVTPAVTVRSVERVLIARLQPSMNVEFIPVYSSCKLSSRKVVQRRRVIRQRGGTAGSSKGVVKRLCAVTVMNDHSQFPDLSTALGYAYTNNLRDNVCLRMMPGQVNCTHVADVVATYGRSQVRVVNEVSGEQLAGHLSVITKHHLSQPCMEPRVVVIDKLCTSKWRLWARKQLIEVLRLPCTVKQWYKLEQRSIFRLWLVARDWLDARQRAALTQLCVKVCKRVHGVDLSYRPVIRLPYGMQHMHKVCRRFLRLSMSECSNVHHDIQRWWCSQARVVQQQGRNIGSMLGNFRHVCRVVDCSVSADGDNDDMAAGSNAHMLPTVNGNVSFRGDDPQLPTWLMSVVSNHRNYVPAQDAHASACTILGKELVRVREQLRVRPGDALDWAAWLRAQACSHPVVQCHPSAVPISAVMHVKKQLRGLVGVPVDKNNILYFESVPAYRQRLRKTFVLDSDHYSNVVMLSESDILRAGRKDFVARGWNKYSSWNTKGTLGFAQCLPKNKDCQLSRPIIPNFKHPMARLFNIAARGMAFVLQFLKMPHFNLFTTQQFVAQLATLSPVVAEQYSLGTCTDVVCVQSDIKDMYTEIAHADIIRCVKHVQLLWQQQTAKYKSAKLCINRSGRCGVSINKSTDRSQTVAMDFTVVVQIVLYELQNAYFKVGSQHLLRQKVGVSMGSKAGPVLAWTVCMVHEYHYLSTLGADAKFIHVSRYFDDVWQLFMIPTDAPSGWLNQHVARLQTACYPTSLRLIQNSIGKCAHMLGCWTSVKDGDLLCVHRCKTDRDMLLQPGDTVLPRVSFIAYHSAHARRTMVMRNTVLGLLHRLRMDTLPKDVHLLLPVLMCYVSELTACGFPCRFILTCFQKFMSNQTVRQDAAWLTLHMHFQHVMRVLLGIRS